MRIGRYLSVAQASAAIRDRLANHASENADRITAALVDLACGVTVQEFDNDTGEERIYTRAPSIEALKYVIDRHLGTPTSKKEVKQETTRRITLELGQPGRAALPQSSVDTGEEDADVIEAQYFDAPGEPRETPDQSPAKRAMRVRVKKSEGKVR